MTRPTIRDLADAAGVSVSTVNRVLGGAGNVRQATMLRIQETAETSASTGSARSAATSPQNAPRHRFGFLLHQPTRPWYRNLAQALEAAAGRVQDRDVQVRIEFAQDLSPQYMAAKLRELGERMRSHRRRRGRASADLAGGRRPEAARRAGVRADLAAFGKRQRPLCRPRQLEGRTHRRPGRSPTSARRRASSASSSATIATAARR